MAELQWRAEHPTEARQLDALHGIEDAILSSKQVRCTSNRALGQTWASCR